MGCQHDDECYDIKSLSVSNMTLSTKIYDTLKQATERQTLVVPPLPLRHP